MLALQQRHSVEAENRSRDHLWYAREVRQIASRLRHREPKRVLLEIAMLYRRMAKRNGRRALDNK